MKTITRIAVISVFFTLATGIVQAQTTNVYMQAYFALNGFRQNGDGHVASVRIVDKDIIAALNATGNFNFGSNAKLLLKSNNDQLPVFVVREKNGNQVTTTDISNFLSLEESSEVNAQNGLVSYATWVFTLNSGGGTSFSVTGFISMYRGKIKSPGVGPLLRVFNAGGQVVGPASVSGNDAVVHGQFSAGFAKAEID